jgi:hypothetical protein
MKTQSFAELSGRPVVCFADKGWGQTWHSSFLHLGYSFCLIYRREHYRRNASSSGEQDRERLLKCIERLSPWVVSIDPWGEVLGGSSDNFAQVHGVLGGAWTSSL